MRRILLDESTASKRRVRIKVVSDVDRYTPLTGESWAAADIQVSQNGATEADSAGSVTEIGGGNYYYVLDATEVDTEGFVLLRLDKTGAAYDEWELHVSPMTDEATALLDMTAGVETGSTVRGALRIYLSVLAGKLDGAGTAEERFRDTNDTKDRVTAAVESTGNRTTVTLDDT